MHCQSFGAQASRGIEVVAKQESTMLQTRQYRLESAATNPHNSLLRIASSSLSRSVTGSSHSEDNRGTHFD
jgi:hypothetical protein